jgi:hypothetical protein
VDPQALAFPLCRLSRPACGDFQFSSFHPVHGPMPVAANFTGGAGSHRERLHPEDVAPQVQGGAHATQRAARGYCVRHDAPRCAFRDPRQPLPSRPAASGGTRAEACLGASSLADHVGPLCASLPYVFPAAKNTALLDPPYVHTQTRTHAHLLARVHPSPPHTRTLSCTRARTCTHTRACTHPHIHTHTHTCSTDLTLSHHRPTSTARCTP